MSFCLRPNVCKKCGKPLTLFEGRTCLECEKAEQEPSVNDVLKQIRAEIEQNAYPIVHGVNNHEQGMTLYGILQIIDKYKGDKE